MKLTGPLEDPFCHFHFSFQLKAYVEGEFDPKSQKECKDVFQKYLEISEAAEGDACSFEQEGLIENENQVLMPRPCPSASRLLRTFFKSHNFFIMEKFPVSEEF